MFRVLCDPSLTAVEFCDPIEFCDQAKRKMSTSVSTSASSASGASSASSASNFTKSCVSLEDIAKDAFRKKFFLQAFPEERDALEESFGFLTYVRKYKQLGGRKELLFHVVSL